MGPEDDGRRDGTRGRALPVILLAAGILVALGAAAPWVRVPARGRQAEVAGTRIHGSSLVAGGLVFAGGVILVVLAACLLLRRGPVVRLLTFLVAAATAGAAIYDLGRLQGITSQAGGRPGLGYGLLLSTSAAAVALLAAGAAGAAASGEREAGRWRSSTGRRVD